MIVWDCWFIAPDGFVWVVDGGCFGSCFLGFY